MSMPASWREFLGFGFSARLVFKGGRPHSENSKLVKAPTVPKVTSRNPGRAAGAHWHRYQPWSRRTIGDGRTIFMHEVYDGRAESRAAF